MTYWIKKLQTQLGIGVTGVFDEKTLDSVKHIINPPQSVLMLLQEFFNRIYNSNIKINGEFDIDTREKLLLFQKDYGRETDKTIDYSKFDEPTWELIGKVANRRG